MTGKKSGVITLLKGDKSSVTGAYCCGHRLELAYKDEIHKNPLAEKITTLLSGLYYFYWNGALNKTNLKNAYTCMGMKVLLSTQAGGTRWVSHVYKALDHLLNGYKAFWVHLEQLASSNERGESEAKAQGFLKLMRCHNVIAMALFMQDVLFVLKKVSLKFQEENSVVAEGALSIKNTNAQLNAMRSKMDHSCKKIKEFEITDDPLKFNIKVTGSVKK